MYYRKGTIFVLGAGFTKAFLPSAPLLEDDYGAASLLEEFQGDGFRYARLLLEEELELCGNGKINVERLMTRLNGRMPYDVELRGQEQLGLLLSALTRCFIKRIADARASHGVDQFELYMFANHVITQQSHCITFNYDDLLDNALWEWRMQYGNGRGWSPDRGYGFPCRSAQSCLQEVPPLRQPSQMLLLKLHGSLNWRVPLGYAKPSPLEVVRHHEEWSTAHPDEYRVPAQFVESVLEQEPVIIPPVLSKSSLMEQPILRFLWSRAYEALAEAKHVVFIGYSMPTTDISTGYLFREGLRHVSPEKDITVVDYAGTAKDVNDKQPLVHAAYKKVFPKIGESQIVLSGAKSWILDNLTEWLFDSKGQPVAFLFGKNVISCDGRFIGAMIDSTIVWGEGEDGLSPYVGEVESGRLVVRSGEISSAKHVCVKPQTSPRVPSQVPPQVDPITLREGLRDFELSASPT